MNSLSPSSGIVRETLSPTESSSLSAVGLSTPIAFSLRKSCLLPSISSVLTRSKTVSSTAPRIKGLWLYPTTVALVLESLVTSSSSNNSSDNPVGIPGDANTFAALTW